MTQKDTRTPADSHKNNQWSATSKPNEHIMLWQFKIKIYMPQLADLRKTVLIAFVAFNPKGLSLQFNQN